MSIAVTIFAIFTNAPVRGGRPALPLAALALATVLLASSSAQADELLPRVAVHEIQTDRVRLKPELLRVLRRSMAAGLAAAGGYRLVPEDKLREALMKAVKDSRKQCFAESCWIEVGQALNADRALTTRVMLLNGQCVVTAALFNVKTQVSERGGRVTGSCKEAGLQASFDRVLPQITGKKPDLPPAEPGGGGPGPGNGGFEVDGAEVTRPVARLIVQVTPRTARVKVTGPGDFSSTGGWSWERRDLAPGSYKVVAGAKGYVNSERDVELSVDDLKTVRLTLQHPGNLHVVGSPPGARVELSGPGGISLIKGLPVKVKGAPAGTYRVKVSRQGYKSEERDVELRAGATTKVEVRLPKETERTTEGKTRWFYIKDGLKLGPETTASVRKKVLIGDIDKTAKVWKEGLQSWLPLRTLPEFAKLAGQGAGATSAGKAGLVWVRISGGGFQMGSTEGSADEKPVHSVQVASYSLLKSEVTVGQYRGCVAAGACSEPEKGGSCVWGKGTNRWYESLPINCVDWNQARKFCAWAGGRLPSEAEWEYAARSGGKAWKYPWGNEEATCSRAVMDEGGWGCGKRRTWPVCSKPSGNSAQGICDLAGNVWEWVEDCWHVSYTGAPSSGKAWTESCSDSVRVFRGGGWLNGAGGLRAAYRVKFTPRIRNYYLGFRCAR